MSIATHITVVPHDGAFHIETFTAGDSTPVDVIDTEEGDERHAPTTAATMAAEQGLTFFEWSGEPPLLTLGLDPDPEI
jgi:hypothetical protein